MWTKPNPTVADGKPVECYPKKKYRFKTTPKGRSLQELTYSDCDVCWYRIDCALPEKARTK